MCIRDRPAPGWRIELHDDDGNPVGVGEEGRIVVRLDPRPVGLFVEYLDNPEANQASFQNGFYYKMCIRDRMLHDMRGFPSEYGAEKSKKVIPCITELYPWCDTQSRWTMTS